MICPDDGYRLQPTTVPGVLVCVGCGACHPTDTPAHQLCTEH